MKERTPGSRTKHEMQRSRETVERLIESEISDKQKVAALLAYTGDKPMSQLGFANNGSDVVRIMETRDIIKNLGLYISEREYVHTGRPRIDFYFGKDRPIIDKMRQLDDRPGFFHTKEWHRAFGKSLGFPDTAVEAFLAHRDMLDDLPQHVRETPAGKFFDRGVAMRLSRDHWQEELGVISKWLDSARSVAPKYIDHLLSDAWEPPEGGAH
jgi:hypothetical protein